MLSHDDHWQIPPQDRQLVPHEVHVWRVLLIQSHAVQQRLFQYLNAEERQRAERYRFEQDRSAFIVTHGVLRTLLAAYTGRAADELAFVTNAYGKPTLAATYGLRHLHFNLSHSHELALFGFAYDVELGIDLEYKRAGIDFDGLAGHSFSEVERAALKAVPATQKADAFYRCWSRKEAYIKARGMGLSMPLSLFDVSLKEGEAPTLLSSREDPREVGRWQFMDLPAGEEYAASLVIDGQDWHMQNWQWVGE